MLSTLTQFRSAAKQLKKAYAAGDPAAIARLREFLPPSKTPKHADFLHVIAREAGHESWPKLKFALEAASMDVAQRARRLGQALYYGQRWVVEKLLSDDPQLAQHDFALQLATYDLQAVQRVLAKDAERARSVMGRLTPILVLSYSQYIHMVPEKRDDMLAIAELLVAHGADVSDGFHPDTDQAHKLSALYGALGHGNNMALASWLLAHGANPDDNESLYHATELGHLDGLKLLMQHGVTTAGTNALPRALDFNNTEMVRLLLDYGADPNELVAGHESGQPVPTIPALHHAARRWCSAEIAGLLLNYGADATLVWQGHSPYAMARIFGNSDVANVLEARGLATSLSRTEQILADCAAGIVPDGRLVPGELNDEDARLLIRIVAGPVSLDHLKALVAVGLDPHAVDEMDMTALYIAGWEGMAERVAYFLGFSPDLTHKNAYGGDALDTVVHGSEFCPKADERDHIACAQMLIDAGAVVQRSFIDGCGNEAMAAFLEDQLNGGA